MVSVTKKWIAEHVKTLYAFGGQVDKDYVLENVKVPRGGFDTNLTGLGKIAVETQDIRDKFNILLPDGLGWADAFGYYSGEEEETE